MARAFASLGVLAQHGGHDGGSGQLAYTILLVTVLTVIWIAVGVVCWIFWRAKKREDAAVRESTRPATALDEKEGDWRNAPLS